MKRVLGADPVIWQQREGVTVLAKAHGLSLQQKTFVHPVTGEDELFTEFIKNEGITTCAITEEGNLLLIREFAQAVGQVVWKFPAGVAKKDKLPSQTARDEVEEETGYRPSEVIETSPDGQPLWLGPRKSSSGFRTFVALGCKPIGQQRLDPGEAQIAVYEMEQHEFWLVYRKGAIRAVETVMAAFNAARLGHIVWPDR